VNRVPRGSSNNALLPDLLFYMGMEPLSKPQKGVRQYGVDVAAVGPDLADQGIRKLFLFVIKPGDIGRNDWDGNPQAVRPSLCEVLEVYLRTHVRQEHKALPKEIVLCCGGDLKQDVQMSWAQFTRKRSKRGKVHFEFWGANKLAMLIGEHLLDEFLFPETARKRMRKTLALLGDPDYDLRDFHDLVEEILFGTERPPENCGDAVKVKEEFKAVRLFNLSLSIVFHWAKDADNLKPAYLAAERALLRTRSHSKALGEFARIHETYRKVATAYFGKVQPYCYVRDGFFGYGGDEIEYPTFEVIGILSVLGMDQVYSYLTTRKDGELENVRSIADALVNLIRNNPPARSPRYDGHAIDIGL